MAGNYCTSESCCSEMQNSSAVALFENIFVDKIKQKQELLKCTSIIINFLLSKINITFSILGYLEKKQQL